MLHKFCAQWTSLILSRTELNMDKIYQVMDWVDFNASKSRVVIDKEESCLKNFTLFFDHHEGFCQATPESLRIKHAH